MCENCGCSDPVRRAAAPEPAHDHGGERGAVALSHNDRLAERNRGFFQAKQVFVVNLLSFAGAGRRALLERTLAEYGRRRRVALLTGEFLEKIHALHDHDHAHAPDPAAANRADENISLDAHMIDHALDHLDLDHLDVLLLENGGSAASQAVQDLGETARVALFSAPDGEYKPLKFPLFFAGAAAVLVTELDQAGSAGFDAGKAREHLRQVAPEAAVLEIAPRTGAGLEAWYAFLDAGVQRLRNRHGPESARAAGEK